MTIVLIIILAFLLGFVFGRLIEQGKMMQLIDEIEREQAAIQQERER
jgi:hypothetical protein